jgi:hypothetical protein
LEIFKTRTARRKILENSLYNKIEMKGPAIARAAPEIEYVPWEQVMSSGDASKNHWDLVWVDAPCSGSGIVRRHPDVRWLRQEKEIAVLVQQQKKLIREAWDRVAPGGFLAYSVCSIFSDEGEILKNSSNPDVSYNLLIRPWKSSLILLYIKNESFLLDCQIIFLTLLNFFNREKTLRLIHDLVKKKSPNNNNLHNICLRKEKLLPININTFNFIS